MTEARINAPGDATVPAGTQDGDSQLTGAELRALLGDAPGENFAEYGDRKLLGIGGMGAVYSGVEPGLNRKVAVKVLRPQYRYSAERIEAFIREARLTAKIDHPNIVPVHRFGVFDDAGVYFTMRRIAGDTLNSIISNVANDIDDYRRKYTLRRLTGIFLSACHAVAFAHSRGVMHGDLKPGNIMVGKYGEVLVMDWGLAYDKSGEKEQDETLIKALMLQKTTLSNDIGGTPAFMAPEHISGEYTTPDSKSEVYALGAILYSILTLKKGPFEQTHSRSKLARKIVSGKLLLPRKAAPKYREVPRELEAICLKAMAKDRDRRYNTVDELITEIMNYLDGYPVKAYSPLFIYRMQKRIVRKPLVPALIFVFIMVGAFFYEWNMFEIKKDIQIRHSIALSAVSQGNNHSRTLRRYNRMLRQTNLDINKRRDIEQITSAMIMRTANIYETAFSNFAEVPQQIMLTDAKVAVSEFILTGKDLNTYSLSREASLGFRNAQNILVADFISVLNRHKNIVHLAVKDNKRIDSIYTKLTGTTGTLMLPDCVSNGSWQLDICDNEGKRIRTYSLLSDGTELKLLPGEYILKFHNDSIGTVNMPLLLNRTNIFVCDIKFPSVPIPDEMAYIPGLHHSGEINSFFIRTREVSIKEFVEFWKTLPADEKAASRVRVYSEKDKRFLPLWDIDGKILHPYKPDDPVFGITLDCARNYCRYLSRKLNRSIRLPEQEEWNRAAFCFNSNNISVYGIDDLNRHVRELLASKSSNVFNRNIGFRYVMDLTEK